MPNRPRTCAVLIAALILSSEALYSDVVKIRHREGPARGFVVVRDLSGKIVGSGELIQVEKRNRLVSRLIMHFKDGSLYDDMTEFTQRGNFKLIRHHLIQSGPSFKLRMETNLDVSTGRFTARYTEKGEDKEINAANHKVAGPSGRARDFRRRRQEIEGSSLQNSREDYGGRGRNGSSAW
jgi:hypothetical protein